MKRRIYADTSVIGGCLDEEFKEVSLRLMDEFRKGKSTLVLSDLTLRELQEAPVEVSDILDSIPSSAKEYIMLDDEARRLAHFYVEEEAVSPSHIVDAQHIAISTIHNVTVLVSWNFKHIVNLDRIQKYNATNLKHGYHMLEIRSPREIIDE